MAQTLTPEAVVRVAREVFPGLTDENFNIDAPNPDTGWCVTFSFVGAPVFSISCSAGSASCMGNGGHGVDVSIASLSTEAELRSFLEDCRDSLARNLEAALVAVLGPVRVLPVSSTLDGLTISNFNFHSQHLVRQGGTSVGELLDTYAAEVAKQRAAAKKGLNE